MTHILTRPTINRLYKLMRDNNVTSSDICRELNIDYPCFKAMLDGKQPCFSKWQTKIAQMLNVDKKILFKEMWNEISN